MVRAGIGVKEAGADDHEGRSDCPAAVFGIYSGGGNDRLTTSSPSTYSMKKSLDRFHSFLRRLRAGGRSNMYGAIPYLMRRFDLDRDTAFRVICDWVDAQDVAELASAATQVTSPRLAERTPRSSRVSRRRSRPTS
jgi:hypothetical protein